MFSWLKRFFTRPRFVKVAQVGGEGMIDDPSYEAARDDAIFRAWTTGNVIIGNRREDGGWDMTEVERKPD